MIKLSEKVRMHCDDGCGTSVRVELVLLPSGGFGIDVPQHALSWQVLMDSQHPTRPYRARCPKCQATTPTVTGPRIVTA